MNDCSPRAHPRGPSGGVSKGQGARGRGHRCSLFQPVQGVVDAGETMAAAVAREPMEEVGIEAEIVAFNRHVEGRGPSWPDVSPAFKIRPLNARVLHGAHPCRCGLSLAECDETGCVMSDMDDLLVALHALSISPRDKPSEHISDKGAVPLGQAAHMFIPALDTSLEYVSDWDSDRLGRAARALKEAGKIRYFRFIHDRRSNLGGAALRVWMPRRAEPAAAPIDDPSRSPAAALLEPDEIIRDPTPARFVRLRSFEPPSFYIALLLAAVRDRSVYDWKSLKRFQKYHSLQFIKWGSSMVGEAPAVVDLLRNLERSGLVAITGISLRDIWVRTDNFSQAPAGKLAYDPDEDNPSHEPDHSLDGPSPLSRDALNIAISPQWQPIQDTLGISLRLLAELQNSRAMVVAPEIFPEPHQAHEYTDVFVAMPFDTKLQPVFNDHIKKVCQDLKLSVSRADHFYYTQEIMADVWGAIKNAKIVVADCTRRNANVFYEMGIAHTLGKKVILLSQKEKDFPFDVSHLRHIYYEFTPRGMERFEESLANALSSSLGDA
jgi:hypothetical protein